MHERLHWFGGAVNEQVHCDLYFRKKKTKSKLIMGYKTGYKSNRVSYPIEIYLDKGFRDPNFLLTGLGLLSNHVVPMHLTVNSGNLVCWIQFCFSRCSTRFNGIESNGEAKA